LSGVSADRNRKDFVGGFRSDFFDIHAAGCRRDERNTADLTINKHAEIELAVDIRTLLDIHRVDGQAFRASLVRYENAAQHLVGVFANLVHCAALTAAFGESAGMPRGTGMPYSANNRLDWYS
jgi:hypothetical protein